MSPPFLSPLAQEMRAFLAFKRSLGHPYRRGEFTLRSFDRYLQRHVRSRRGSLPLESALLGWLASSTSRKPVSVATELGVIRQLCLFRRRRDPQAFVPDRSWAPQSTQSDFVPYILSKEQIVALLESADHVRGTAFRALSVRTLLLILYCTGLRLGEAIRLVCADVDLDRRVLFVRESKRRSRLVPFHADLAHALRRYRCERDRHCPDPGAAAFLVGATGRPYTPGTASETIRRLFRRLDFKPAKGRVGPRPHDIRHTFAVHRLTRWYRAGVDIHARLPSLSAYMGHQDILGTETYLTATPDLLAIAAHRFERRVRKAQGPS